MKVMPREVTLFLHIFMNALTTFENWFYPLCDPELDRSESFRNRAFGLLIYGLTDVLRTAKPDLLRMSDDSAFTDIDFVRFYLPTALAMANGIGAVVGTFSRDDQICIAEARHQWVHGHRRGVSQPSRKVAYWDGAAIQEPHLTNREINDLMIEAWSPGGLDPWLTDLRCRLGERPLFFWPLLAALRHARDRGLFTIDTEELVAFDIANPWLEFYLPGGTYSEAEADPSAPKWTFYDFCAWSAPKGEAPLDPFVERCRAFRGAGQPSPTSLPVGRWN